MLAEITHHTVVDPPQAARSAGLRYVCADDPGILRRPAGKGFSYQGPDAKRVTDAETLERIRKLAIPPAWRDVWICADPRGHLQAVGLDARGRKQYRYHPRFREVRESGKFDHLIAFAEALPALRERVAADMRKSGLGHDKVVATVVHLLETTMIRVGNTAYAKANRSYGLTTLRTGHVQVEGAALKFHFRGKSGKVWRLGVRDRRVAKIVRACQEIPGQQLFQYLDEHGERQTVTSADVNAYLQHIAGADLTAKDFRTWAGTVLAARTLAEQGADSPPTKKQLAAAIAEVAAQLGNTSTICRKCYVHPQVMSAYLDGALRLEGCGAVEVTPHEQPGELTPHEAAVLAFLQSRAKAAKNGDMPRPK